MCLTTVIYSCLLPGCPIDTFDINWWSYLHHSALQTNRFMWKLISIIEWTADECIKHLLQENPEVLIENLFSFTNLKNESFYNVLKKSFPFQIKTFPAKLFFNKYLKMSTWTFLPNLVPSLGTTPQTIQQKAKKNLASHQDMHYKRFFESICPFAWIEFSSIKINLGKLQNSPKKQIPFRIFASPEKNHYIKGDEMSAFLKWNWGES